MHLCKVNMWSILDKLETQLFSGTTWTNSKASLQKKSKVIVHNGLKVSSLKKEKKSKPQLNSFWRGRGEENLRILGSTKSHLLSILRRGSLYFQRRFGHHEKFTLSLLFTRGQLNRSPCDWMWIIILIPSPSYKLDFPPLFLDRWLPQRTMSPR